MKVVLLGYHTPNQVHIEKRKRLLIKAVFFYARSSSLPFLFFPAYRSGFLKSFAVALFRSNNHIGILLEFTKSDPSANSKRGSTDRKTNF